MVKEAIGKWAAQPLVEKHKRESVLAGQPVGISFAVPLDQTVCAHLAQIIPELVQAVSRGGEFKGGQNSVVDLLGRPPALCSASVKQHLHKPDHPRVVNLDAGKLRGTHRDRVTPAAARAETRHERLRTASGR
jgi:hypothetical protein